MVRLDMMPQTRHQKQTAFTLIELLVVISIIALLIAILLPALGAARKSARAMQCLTLLRQYATANFVYASDHDGWYVPMRNITASEQTTWAANKYFQQTLNARPTPNGTTRYWKIQSACPETDPARFTSTGYVDIQESYGMNVTWDSSWGYPPYRTYNGQQYRHITQSDLDQLDVSKKVMFCDGLDWQVNGSRVDEWQGSDAMTRYAISGYNGCMSFRHSSNTVMNAAFYDGHAAANKQEDALDNAQMWVLQP